MLLVRRRSSVVAQLLEGGDAQPALAVARGGLPYDFRIQAFDDLRHGIERNHRWTQMDTDYAGRASHRTRSPRPHPEREHSDSGKLASAASYLCSFVSICGCSERAA